MMTNPPTTAARLDDTKLTADWPQRCIAFARALLAAVIACVALAAAGCGVGKTTATAPIAASQLDVQAQVSDDQSNAQTVSLEVTFRPAKGVTIVPRYGSLTCDGTAMSTGEGAAADGVFDGAVSRQSDHYDCTYAATAGPPAQLIIPVALRDQPVFQSPARDEKVPVLSPAEASAEANGADAGLVINYLGATNQPSVSISATARDYNGQTAQSSVAKDIGGILIPWSTFSSSFAIGWGTLSLKRDDKVGDISAAQPAPAFDSVQLSTFEQLTSIPIQWR